MTKEELIKFLQENLTIEINVETNFDSWKKTLDVRLLLDGEVISHDYVYLGNFE